MLFKYPLVATMGYSVKQAFESVAATAIFITVLSILLNHILSLVSYTLTLNTLEYEGLQQCIKVINLIRENGVSCKKWNNWYKSLNNSSVLDNNGSTFIVCIEMFKLSPNPQTIWSITLGDSHKREHLHIVFYTVIVLDDGSMVKIVCLN